MGSFHPFFCFFHFSFPHKADQSIRGYVEKFKGEVVGKVGVLIKNMTGSPPPRG